MTALLAFAIVLLVAVLLSELAERSILSMAVVFLAAGFLAGEGVTDLVPLAADDPIVAELAELALFVVLFTDGMHAGIRDLTAAWRLPGRALLFGMPLTFATLTVLAHLVAGLPWGESMLIAAVLSPTDPVFAGAIVGREGVPRRLRHLLNVESGLNDGLALPVVVILLATLGKQDLQESELAIELLGGIAIGVIIPAVALSLERTRFFSPDPKIEALLPFAIGLVVLAVSLQTHANLFLAAFSAGVTVTSINPSFREAFHDFGSLLSEILKLGAVFVFAALISPSFLAEISPSGYLFALLALLVARPAAIGLAFIGSRISKREWVAAAWFGPKGFASVVYGLLVAESGLGRADDIFHLIGLVVAGSILLHSSTDVMIAHRFKDLQRPDPETPLEIHHT